MLELEQSYGFSRNAVQGHDTVRTAAIEQGSRAKPKYDPSGHRDGQGENFDWWYLGKMLNDRKENPDGVLSLAQLDEVIEASAAHNPDAGIVGHGPLR